MQTEKVIEMMIDALENGGYKTMSYSGRGMMGEKCLAVNLNDDLMREIAQISTLVMNECEDEFNGVEVVEYMEEFFDLLAEARTDSMGLGTVIYFPNIDWDENWGDDSYEDEEDEE